MWRSTLPNDNNIQAQEEEDLCDAIHRALFATLEQQVNRAIQVHAVPKHLDQVWRRLASQWHQHTQVDLPLLRSHERETRLRLSTIAQVDAFLGLLAPLLPEVVDHHLDRQSLAVYDLFIQMWTHTDATLRHPQLDGPRQTAVHQRWGVELAAFDPRTPAAAAAAHAPHILMRVFDTNAADSCEALALRWRNTRDLFTAYMAGACTAAAATAATATTMRQDEGPRARLLAHTLEEKRRTLAVWVQSQEALLRDTTTPRLADNTRLQRLLGQCRATFMSHLWRETIADAVRPMSALRQRQEDPAIANCISVLNLWARATPDGEGWSVGLLARTTAWVHVAVSVIMYRPIADNSEDTRNNHAQLAQRLTRLLRDTQQVDSDRNFSALGLEAIYLVTMMGNSAPLIQTPSYDLSVELARLIPQNARTNHPPPPSLPPTADYASMMQLLGLGI